jgi:hypothetical protein
MLKNAKETVISQIIKVIYNEPDNQLDAITIGKVARELVNRASNIIGTFTNYEQCKAFGKHLASDRIKVKITINLPDSTPSEYGVYVEGRELPKFKHTTLESAQVEASRLSDKTGKRTAVVVSMFEPTRTVNKVF